MKLAFTLEDEVNFCWKSISLVIIVYKFVLFNYVT